MLPWHAASLVVFTAALSWQGVVKNGRKKLTSPPIEIEGDGGLKTENRSRKQGQ